jgi:hypothetical protein
MTPNAEAQFIALWQQGLSHEAMAERLGCPVGTVKSRSHTLQRRGLIQPRPKGQASQRLPRQGDVAGVSADTPGVSRGVSTRTRQRPARVSRRVSADTPGVQYLPPGQGEMLPLLTAILQELRQLTSGLVARVSTDTSGVQPDTPGVSTGVSGGVSARTPLPAERGKSVRWNLHLSARLRERIKAVAAARGLQDSQMVEELLWLALAVVGEDPADNSGKSEKRNAHGPTGPR